ncbi:MGMT family protein [Kaarinaea lacus]
MNKNLAFDEQCYELLKQIPRGKITTYSEIARALKSRAWRAVGSAMAKNQNLIVVPCHRVVRSDGSIGQYALGSERKAELLLSEGVDVSNGRITDLDKYIYKFTNQV